MFINFTVYEFIVKRQINISFIYYLVHEFSVRRQTNIRSYTVRTHIGTISGYAYITLSWRYVSREESVVHI